MFLKRPDYKQFADLSTDLRYQQDWLPTVLRSFEYALDVTALAVDTLSGLLAYGTRDGNIQILGRPGVEVSIELPESKVAIKFLQISLSTFRLVCIDAQNQMHIWDLSAYGKPKYLSSARFDETTCLTLSPSHTHAFIALQSGQIRTYDLICLRKSPYVMPNMWTLYEDKMAASGMPEVSTASSNIPVDAVIHPRNLNLLFVAYAGGVILSDLTQRSTLRVYELVLPPGATGGSGYDHPDILTHRRPEVTGLAIHPAGHFFAVGHADGSIAFWAVEDENQPLLVKTLDALDVNIVDGPTLETQLTNVQKGRPPLEREPIFKLSWSSFPNSPDPRGGETALTILGGLTISDPAGVSSHWLPAFNPPEPPATQLPEGTLHPFLRAAMRESLIPFKTYFYDTNGTVQDYLLVPRDNPHFAGAFNPISILIVSESVGNTRVVEAYQFPPSTFLNKDTVDEDEAVPSSADVESSGLVDDLAATLEALTVNEDPKTLRLPSPLWNGSTGLLNGQLLTLGREDFDRFVDGSQSDDLALPLKGGMVWADETQANEMKLTKYQPPRLLVTWHRNLTVQFHDISAQLLLSTRPTPIEHAFPSPLPLLTIDLNSVLLEPAVARIIPVNRASIHSIQFAPESLECAVVFTTGELCLYRLQSKTGPTSYREAADAELVILDHIPANAGHRFAPYFLLATGRGYLSACALSDIGFLATAYADGSLFIVDMRAPRVILRRGPDSRTKRHTIGLHSGRHSNDTISSLNWTVGPLATDPKLSVRLVAVHQSGLAEIFTISRDGSSWICGSDPISMETSVSPVASFILDAKTGAECTADRARFGASMQNATAVDSHVLFLSAGVKGIRCNVDINGERLAKADWSSNAGTVDTVRIVDKLGSHALVALTDRNEIMIYSIPHLEHLYSIPLPLDPSLPLSIDETGDYIAWIQHSPSGIVHRAKYGTLFNSRRISIPPDIELSADLPAIPSQPQPISAGPSSLLTTASSWFGVGASITGDQLDALLAGPDRPMPETPLPISRGLSYETVTAGASSLAASTAAAQTGIYNRLSSALNERGQMLGELQDSFNNLEQGSRNMAAQAKRLAAQQTAKGWFSSFG